MKKNVSLKIKSSQYEEKLQPSGEAFARELQLEDSIEIQTEGTLYTKENATYITYNESEQLGMNDARTVIKITSKPDTDGADSSDKSSLGAQTLSIRRYAKGDEDNMDMHLQQGRRNITRYKIPQVGSMDIEVYTHKLEEELNEDGFGRIFVDYKIKFDTMYSRRNQLEIQVSK